MIRKWQSEDTAPLLSLWLESTTEAHPFIDANYWQANEAVVRDEYLPAAETWVWEENSTLCGFISVMQFQFVGALFVAPAFIGKGIGPYKYRPRPAPDPAMRPDECRKRQGGSRHSPQRLPAPARARSRPERGRRG